MSVIGAYALFIPFPNLYWSWYSVAFSKFSGSPSIASTTKSFVTLYCASDGATKKSLGFIIFTSSLYKALNKISKDTSVPLLK